MSKTPYQISDLALGTGLQQSFVSLSYLTPVNGAPGAGQFRSSISGRAPMIDLSNDLMPRMGVERIQVQSIMRVDGETGPAGEAVFKPVNDKWDQIRYVGAWGLGNDANGQLVADSTNTTDYLEITFYGTGLNILARMTGAYNYSVDGGSEVAGPSPAAGSAVLQNRNYSSNAIFNIVSNLTLGIHTVKIRNTNGGSGARLYGFEILNESTSIKTSAGSAFVDGKKRVLGALDSSAYNSGFTNQYGTAGTRGGRVLVYMKSDGTIAKDVRWTNTASATLGSADHSNEEVIRSYYWREFGAGRSDDFSTVTSASATNRAFTLDDGATTLVGQNIQNATVSEYLSYNSVSGNFITFTFIGTGLDIHMTTDASTRQFDAVSIDGTASIGAISVTASTFKVAKVVSGLPYGTHTVKLSQTSVTFPPAIISFMIYGPKKPSIPSGAMELADYNIMADFTALASLSNAVDGIPAAGILRKFCFREIIYSGTWGIGINVPGYAGSFHAETNATGAYWEYTFVGTGVDIRLHHQSGLSMNSTISVDGSTNLTGFATGVVSSGDLPVLVAATGVLSRAAPGADAAVSVRITGMTYGKHTIRMTNTNPAYLQFLFVDVITPIHTHKNNGPIVLQNTLSVGSQGVNDGRNLPIGFKDLPIKAATESAVNAVTTSAAAVPIGEAAIAIYAAQDSILDISFTGSGRASAANLWSIVLYVDGVAQRPSTAYGRSDGLDIVLPAHNLVQVSKGWHYVAAHMMVSAGSLTLIGGNSSNLNRNLTVDVLPLKS